MSLPCIRTAATAAFSIVLAANAGAQIPIGGAVSGTLAAGVYHTNNSLNVPVGQTLTLNPGVIIKFTSSGHQLTVDGTLIANGTTSDRVIFTDIQDDSAGGDTNGNGPSAGNWTAWQGIVMAPTASASSLTNTDIRFGGSGFVSNLELNSCNATFTDCVIHRCYTHGMDLNGNSRPTVSGCVFTGNGGLAIEGVPMAALAAFSNNTASGNQGEAGNYARVTEGAVNANLTLGPTAMISGALVIDANIAIDVAATLTLQAGVNCKFRSAVEVRVDGTLRTNGTAANPVIFTALADDTAGGDTNGNGASTGSATAWRGIVFQATASASALTWTEARFGGSGFVSNFELNSCNATFTDCVIHNCYTHGMDLNGNSLPTVTRCAFTGNGGFAVEGVPMAALPGFVDNTATGNQSNSGNFARVTVGAVNANLTVGPRAMISGAVVLDTTVSVAPGATLTLAAGVNCKFRSPASFVVDGTLIANGTAGSPVVFTALADDSAGGDTNGNGPSSGNSTAWRGIEFNAGASASTLDHTHIRFGGSGFVSNVELNASSPTFRNCTIRNCYTHGMDLNENSLPVVKDCAFTDNGGYAVHNVPIQAVPGFTNNTASGNQGNSGNFLHITTANVTGFLVLGSQSMINGALVLGTSLTVASNGVLVVQQGTVFKFRTQSEVTVDGVIDLRGTGYEPVVFTALADDDHGGDTNGNGPGSGGPAAWRGLVCNAVAGPSQLENVVIRYPGSGFVPGLSNSSPNVALRAVRVDRAYDRGFVLGTAAGRVSNLVAWGCGGHGLHLTAGNFDVVHATVNGCNTGIRRENWNGSVINSIVWGNSTNFANFGTGAQVVRSNGGFVGQNANMNVDPAFEHPPTGNLHLQATSLCLNVADLSFGVLVAKDFDENSRVLDHALNGAALPDLGAFERPAWDMTMTGIARPGATVGLTVVGPPGFSFWFMGIQDGYTPVNPYGMLLAGLPGASIALLVSSPVPTGFTLPITLVNNPALIGATTGIQTLTFPPSGLNVGNFTRLLRALVRP